jgi:hypothetical protein
MTGTAVLIAAAARPVANTTRCVRCGKRPVTGEGWRVDVAPDPRADVPGELLPVAYCPECRPATPPPPITSMPVPPPRTATATLGADRPTQAPRPGPRPTRTDPAAHVERAIVELLATWDGPAPTVSEIADELNRDPRCVGAKLHRLEAVGRVMRVGRGRGQRPGWEVRS